MRDPSPAPAHKIPAAGPRSTSSPSSPSTTKNDLHMPETSLDPQGNQAMKTDFQFNDLQASISLQAASGIQASSEIAKDPNVHDPPKDGKSLSAANDEIPNKDLYVFHPSRTSSDQRSDVDSAPSPNVVISDSPLTHGEDYEEGASRPWTGTTQSPFPELVRSQNQFLSDPNKTSRHISLSQESKHLQGKVTAKADPPQFKDQFNSDASTAIAILSTMAMETAMDLPIVSLPTHPLASSTSIAFKEVPESNPNPLMNLPASITNPIKNGIFESFGLPTALPKDSHRIEADAAVGSLLITPSSQNDLVADDAVKTTTLPKSTSDPRIQVAASDGPGVSMAPPSSTDAAHPVATTGVTQTSRFAAKADTPPSLSGPSSSVLVGANGPQSEPSNDSSRAGFGNQTALVLEVGGGVLTTGTRAQGSEVSKKVFGGGTVLPFRNGGGRSGGVFLRDAVGRFACLVYLLLGKCLVGWMWGWV